MAKFKISRKALEDLSSIWDYTFEVWSEAQADSYYSMIIKSCEELAKNKIKGKVYTEVSDDLFGTRVGQHIIFFRMSDKSQLEIIRILHGRMDLKSKLSE